MKNAVEMNENQVVEEVKEAETPVETEVKKEKGWKLFGWRKQKAQKEPKKDVKAEDKADEAGKRKEIIKKVLVGIAIVSGVAGGYELGKFLNSAEESDSEEDSTLALPPQEAEWTPIEESVPVSADPATMESPKED